MKVGKVGILDQGGELVRFLTRRDSSCLRQGHRLSVIALFDAAYFEVLGRVPGTRVRLRNAHICEGGGGVDENLPDGE
jgi:hypothetical protein